MITKQMIKALKSIDRFEQGGCARLSECQIMLMTVNMEEAQQNLTNEEFERVYLMFREFFKTKYKEKHKMNVAMYVNTAVNILKTFDKVAPCEKYCGKDGYRAELLMNEVRKQLLPFYEAETISKFYELLTY